ncbi:collagen alpha-2(I) chain [Talpa occidentalis]|uniref:collagen alpha-2(I) chain n=1 Tax=Talpa occidentalis TaxID=50954 RepID=UPI0023FA4556|nr:collagen alpha-2(I) chain [Talpa occidentalis]
MGHESILELWLKVQAMRAASGCEEGSRVELHPLPAGDWPVERGIPGQASWIETTHGGVTGPWVKSQTMAVPQATGVTTAMRLRAVCERVSALCGQRPAVRVSPSSVPETVEISADIIPHQLGRVQASRMPGTVEELGYGVASGSWGKGPTLRVPGTVGCPEAAEVPRAVEGVIGYGGAPGLRERGQSVQVPGTLAYGAACSGDIPGLWGSGQAVELPDTGGMPRVMEEETTSVGVPGVWQRQVVEETGSGGVPGLWATRQPVEVPCATEELRYGGDPGFRERGQAVWGETGSGDELASWEETAQTAEVSGPEEQEAGPGDAPGLWAIEQAVEVPQALGKDAGCGGVPSLWGIEQPVGVSQAVAEPGALGEQTKCGGVLGLWERQQASGVPLAEAVPEVVGDEICGGNDLSLWERRQAAAEQMALVPPALGISGPVDPETGCGDASCLCGRKQAVGLSETVARPGVADVPKHRCAPAGAPAAVGVPRSGSVPTRVPAAVWVSGPVDQESPSRDVLNLWERADSVRIASAPEELWSVGEEDGSAAFPGAWGRSQAIGVPMTTRISMASEVPGLVGADADFGGLPRSSGRRQSDWVPVAAEIPEAPRVSGSREVDNASGGFSGLPGRRQNVGVPVTTGVSTSGGVPVAPRAPRLVQEETDSGGISGLCGARETVRRPADGIGHTRMGVLIAARMPGPLRERAGPRGISDLSGRRQTAGLSMAGEVCTATGMPGPVGEEALSGGLLGFPGRRQTAEMAEASGVSMTVGVPAAQAPGLMVVHTSSGDIPGVWGRRRVTEVPAVARASGSVDGESGSETGPWRRRPNGPVPEAPRIPLSLGVLPAVGVPAAGRAPAAVWVTGSAGKDTRASVSGLTAVRRQSTEGPGASGEMGGRSVLGLDRRSQAPGVSYTCGRGTRLWSSPRSVREEIDSENVPGVSGTRTTQGMPEVVEVLPVVREDSGFGRFRAHSQQNGRRPIRGVCGMRVGENNLRDNYMEEDRFRGSFQ